MYWLSVPVDWFFDTTKQRIGILQACLHRLKETLEGAGENLRYHGLNCPCVKRHCKITHPYFYHDKRWSKVLFVGTYFLPKRYWEIKLLA